MGRLIQKLIGNNLGSILGIVQVLIPLVRELVVAAIRVVDVVLTEKDLEPAIKKVVAASNSLEAKWEFLKNLFLKPGT